MCRICMKARKQLTEEGLMRNHKYEAWSAKESMCAVCGFPPEAKAHTVEAVRLVEEAGFVNDYINEMDDQAMMDAESDA